MHFLGFGILGLAFMGDAFASDDATAPSTPEDSSPPSGESSNVEESNPESDATSPSATDNPNVALSSNDPIDPAEIAKFRGALSRFSDRVKAFEEESKAIIRAVEKFERENIQKEYSAQLKGYRAASKNLRATSISRFETFLSKYPNRPEAAQIMIQLANFYFDVAKDDFIALDDAAELEGKDGPDSIDLTRPISLYERVIGSFPQSAMMDHALYMHGYCHYYPLSQQNESSKYVDSFNKLVNDHPDSSFAPEANYILGLYHFNENKLDQAIAHFKSSLSGSAESDKTYETSLYRLAWSNYRKENFNQALRYMVDLLDYSDRRKLEYGKEAITRKDSIDTFAFSFKDISADSNKSPIAVAEAFFKQVGERSYEAEIYQAMAKLLTNPKDPKYSQAIDVYRYMQKRWPFDPNNPVYQHEIAKIYSEQLGEMDGYREAIANLTMKYNDNTEWWRQNRNNPDALDVARRFIESSLKEVALSQYGEALQSNDPDDFASAAEVFGQYLTKFPFADDYYMTQWLLGESLLMAKSLKEAAMQFEQMMKSRDHHDYAELVAFRLDQAYGEMVLVAHQGNFLETPESAEVEKEIDLSDGKSKLTIYRLGDIQSKYIENFKRLSNVEFDQKIADLDKTLTETNEKLGSTDSVAKKEALKSRISEIETLQANLQRISGDSVDALPNQHLKIAQIYFAHNRFEQAREWISKLLKLWPDHSSNEQAASLLIESYQNEMNWEAYVSESQRLYNILIAEDNQNSEFAKELEAYIQNGKLLMAKNIIAEAESLRNRGRIEAATKKSAEAGAAFEEFLKEYPDFEDYANTLLVAADNYLSAGKAEKANELYKSFVDKFPTHEKAKFQLDNIAKNYLDTLDYENAIKYYNILYKTTEGRGVSFEPAIGGLFNIALMKIGANDFAGAAKGLEDFAKKHAEPQKKESIAYRAGQQWEKVSDRKATAFYERYLDQYFGQNPDNTMEALHKLVGYNEKQKRTTRANKLWDRIDQAYLDFKNKGEVTEQIKRIAALSKLRHMENEQKKLFAFKYSKSDKKNAQIAKIDMMEEFDRLYKYCESLMAFKDYDATIASFYCKGTSRLHYAEFVEEYPIPDNLPMEYEDIFAEELEKFYLPIQEAGRTSLEKTVELAERSSRWSDWNKRSINALNKYYPREFAPEKDEFRVIKSSEMVPILGPYSKRDVETQTPQQPSNEETPNLDAAPELPVETAPTKVDSPIKEGGEDVNNPNDATVPNEVEPAQPIDGVDVSPSTNPEESDVPAPKQPDAPPSEESDESVDPQDDDGAFEWGDPSPEDEQSE